MQQLRTLASKTKVTIKDLEILQGKLQFTAIAIPLGKPLLGEVDKILALAKQKSYPTVPVTKTFKAYCKNWRALLHLLRNCPSHVNELVRHKDPAYQGFVDASKWGVGGVWFGGTKELPPFVWFHEWDDDIRQQLCCDDNPEGTITISDLELCGIFMHWLALEAAAGPANLKHQSPAIWCDNLSAVAWTYKSRSSSSRIAANILRALATRLHKLESGLLSIDHISGDFNSMADVASREHDTDLTEFLLHFTLTFPPPQDCCWNQFQHSTRITSRICSELLTETSTMGSWRRLPKNVDGFSTLGHAGLVAISQPYHQICKESEPAHKSSSWLPLQRMLGEEAFLVENRKFVPKRSRFHFEPSAQPSSWTENQVPWLKRKENIRKLSNSYWRGITKKTPPPDPK